MTPEEVVELMEDSWTEKQWNANCDEVKRRCGGDYPHFWFEVMLASGLMAEIAKRWDGDDQIRILSI